MTLLNYVFLLQEEYSHIGNPCNITPEEYFDDTMDLKGRDIGRPKEVNTKIQKFKVIKILNFIVLAYPSIEL
jgi:hypothetical protein